MNDGVDPLGQNVGMPAPPNPSVARRSRVAGARNALAVLLLASGVLFGVFYRFADNAENHSYNAGAQPHFPVHVTLGKQYELSTPGGSDALLKREVIVSGIQCTFGQDGSSSTLGITPLTDSRTVHAFATFVGPLTGDISVSCNGVPLLFVDDADNVPSDPAALFVLLATICLTLGTAVALSQLYRRAKAAAGVELQVDHRGDLSAPAAAADSTSGQ